MHLMLTRGEGGDAAVPYERRVCRGGWRIDYAILAFRVLDGALLLPLQGRGEVGRG